jgi:hypothetical protein
MKESTWRALDQQFAEFPNLRAGSVEDSEIEAVSAALEKEVPPDYREFLRRFGSAFVGPYPIFGLRPVEPMGSMWSVVQVNRHFQEQKWPGVDEWLIVSMDQGGNPIGLSLDGRVWISDHGHVETLASTFEDFLRYEALGLSE